MSESLSPRIRKHPLFPLFHRGLRRLLRGAPDPLRVGDGDWSERVRGFMTRQIIRRTGTAADRDAIYGAQGYSAACEGHNAFLARNLNHYAELCAYDTVEQVLRMQGRRLSEPEAEERKAPSSASEARSQQPLRRPPARGLAAMSSWSRERRQQG